MWAFGEVKYPIGVGLDRVTHLIQIDGYGGVSAIGLKIEVLLSTVF